MACGWVNAKCLLLHLGHEPVLIEHALEAAFGVNPLPPFRQVLAIAAASLGSMSSTIGACRHRQQPSQRISTARDLAGELSLAGC